MLDSLLAIVQSGIRPNVTSAPPLNAHKEKKQVGHSYPMEEVLL